MSRTNRSARQAGSSFERLIADYLAAQLHDDRIDRRVKTGAKDRGDIGGVRTAFGDRVVLEAKNANRIELGTWITEAEIEAGNDDAALGIVVAKRRGKGTAGDQFVVMTVDSLIALLQPSEQMGKTGR